MDSNNEELEANIDLVEGKREMALIRITTQKQRIEKYYSQKWISGISVEDYVL